MTINERGSAAQSTFFAASLLVGKDPNKVKGSQVQILPPHKSNVLLAIELPGAAELRIQAAKARVVGRCECGCPTVDHR